MKLNYNCCLMVMIIMIADSPSLVSPCPSFRFECMNLISRDQADLINVEPEDLYLAGRIYNLEPFAQEDIDGS